MSSNSESKSSSPPVGMRPSETVMENSEQNKGGRSVNDPKSLPQPVMRTQTSIGKKAKKVKKAKGSKSIVGGIDEQSPTIGKSLLGQVSGRSDHEVRKQEQQKQKQKESELAKELEEKVLQDRIKLKLLHQQKEETKAKDQRSEQEMDEAIENFERSIVQSQSSVKRLSQASSFANKPSQDIERERQSHYTDMPLPSQKRTRHISETPGQQGHHKNSSENLVQNPMMTKLAQNIETIKQRVVDKAESTSQNEININSSNSISGQHKSNPYVNLAQKPSPFDPKSPLDIQRQKEREQAAKAHGIELSKPIDYHTKLKQVVGAVAPMRFNLKTENEIKRKLDYTQVLKGLDQVDFSEIDANLKTDYLEASIRDIIVQYVEPLVMLSKKNLIYNANKNQMLEELKDFNVDLSIKMDVTRAEVAVVDTLKQKVKEYKQDFEKSMVDCKTRSSAIDQSNELMNGRMDDFDGRLQTMREDTSIRDRKVSELIDHINKMKQQQADASISTSRKFAKELQRRDQDIHACNKSVRVLDNFISGQKIHLDNLSTSVMRFQIHLDLQDKRLEHIKDIDLSEMHGKIDLILREATKQTNWYTDMNLKLDQSLSRLEPLHDRLGQLEQYTQRSVPLLTHLQISDALQEFLCLHDQLKLIEYDNTRLEQFTASLLNDAASNADSGAEIDDSNSQNSDEPASTTHINAQSRELQKLERKNSATAKDINYNSMLHARLQSLMGMMAEKKQGCIRFQWGRDWNVRDFNSIDEAQNLKSVPYNMYLGNKTNLLKSMLQKDQQMMLMDQVLRKFQKDRENGSSIQHESDSGQSVEKVVQNATIVSDRTANIKSHQGPNTELVSLSDDQKTLDYYTPNFDCGFSGGSQMPTALGTAQNAHFQGSGMNKVFREVTIIKTGGGGSGTNPKEVRLARNLQLNRRKAIALDSVRKKKLMKRIAKTQEVEPIAEISSTDSDNSNSNSPEQNNLVKSQKMSRQGSNVSGMRASLRSEEMQKLTKSQERVATGSQSPIQKTVENENSIAEARKSQLTVIKKNSSVEENDQFPTSIDLKPMTQIIGNHMTKDTASPGLGASSRRPPMIPSEQLENMNKQVDMLGAEINTYRKEFEMYKNSVTREKNEFKLIIAQSVQLTKDVQAQTSKLSGKIEKNKLRNQETQDHLTSRIDQTESYIKQTLKDTQRIFDELNRDNKSFKKYMVEEYIEFFKSKKRIRLEWKQHSSDVQAKVDEYMATLSTYEQKIEAMNAVLPILVELTCMTSKFVQEDVQVRNKLSQKLRLDQLPNQGYLWTEKASASKGEHSTNQKQLAKQSSFGNMKTISSDTLKGSSRKATNNASTLNKQRPLSDQIVPGGGLCVNSFAYRNTELTTMEYLKILHYFIGLCQDHCGTSGTIIEPKSYFDDAMISLRIKKTFDDRISDTPAIQAQQLPDLKIRVGKLRQETVRVPTVFSTPTLPRGLIGESLHRIQSTMTAGLISAIPSFTALPTNSDVIRLESRQMRMSTLPLHADGTNYSPLRDAMNQHHEIEMIKQMSNEKLKSSVNRSKPTAIYQETQSMLMDELSRKTSSSPGIRNKIPFNSRNPIVQVVNKKSQKQHFATSSSQLAILRPLSGLKIPKKEQNMEGKKGSDPYMNTTELQSFRKISENAYSGKASDFSRQESEKNSNKFLEIDKFVGLDEPSRIVVEDKTYHRRQKMRPKSGSSQSQTSNRSGKKNNGGANNRPGGSRQERFKSKNRKLEHRQASKEPNRDISTIDLPEEGLLVEYGEQAKEKTLRSQKPEEQDRPSTATLSKRASIEIERFRISTAEEDQVSTMPGKLEATEE